MERVDYLEGQAALLREVASTFDIPSIRDRLLALANECQILAQLVGNEPKEPVRVRSDSSADTARRRRSSVRKPR